MFKKKIFALLCCMFLACSLLCNITVSAVEPTYINSFNPTANQLIAEVCNAYGAPYQTWDYYILSSPMPETIQNGSSRYFSFFLTDPQYECDIHILNDAYNVNHVGTPFKCILENDVNRGCFLGTIIVTQIDDEINVDYFGVGSYVYNNSNQLGFSDATIFYASNMNVYVGDVNVNEELCQLDISYYEDSHLISYECENLSHDESITFRCGLSGYFESDFITVPHGKIGEYTFDIYNYIDYCTAKGLNYYNGELYIIAYHGIDVCGNYSCTVGDLVSDGDLYDGKKPYEDMPDYEDYVDWDDWEDFPDLDPTPSAPTWDPDESIIENIWKFIQWLGDIFTTWIGNLGKIVRWVGGLIKQFGQKIGQSFEWLKDCLSTIVSNIGIALYNLTVDIRALLNRLFVPRKEVIDSKFKTHFPIFYQVKDMLTTISVSGSSSVDLDMDYGSLHYSRDISFASNLGSTNCTIIRYVLNAIVGCGCFLHIFNIIIRCLGLVPDSGVGGGE